MALTQQQISLQMLAQLRRLDPSVSAEVGTPERKLLDTVAQALSDSQLDLTALQQGLDIDSKYGDGLDRFLALFGFARQKATYSTGFVTFGRVTPSTVDIVIPANTQVRVPAETPGNPTALAAFYTTTSVTLPAGQVEVVAPIRAAVAGSASNVAANTVSEMIGTPILGITAVTNETATRGGVDREGDAELKVRFKNTVFRNLAGTRDQYLALAVSTQYSLKANVVGPQSYWREYMQVPPVDDASSYQVDGVGGQENGFGNAGEYTTALVSLPYAKGIWTTIPAFASNGNQGVDTWFFRPDVDFRFNTDNAARNRGDTARLSSVALGANVLDTSATYRPNFSFINVYTGANADVQAIRPSDIVLCEFAYMSDASRNDLARNITNAVDVYVDGGNNQFATNVLTAPTNATIFVDNPVSKYHYENYRRAGEPTHRPIKGNYFMPLMWEPVTELPAQIIVGDNTYLLNTHYWLVKDTSELRGSVRARNGIEWSQTVKGNSTGTARLITEWVGVNFAPIEIENYQFDRNIVDLQAALEASKQVTTDVLAHKAAHRYFKFDIVVMYSPGALKSEVNQDIHDAVDTYLKSQYFGALIQLSDVLQIIHGVDGVDNVRWSSDYTANSSLDIARVWEVDRFGKPLVNVMAEHIILGTASTPARQALYLTGQPNNISEGIYNSYFKVRWNGITAAANIDLDSQTLTADIKAALESIAGLGTVTVTEEVRTTAVDPIRSFIIQWSANGVKAIIEPISHLKGSPTTVLNTDFVLRDSELPALPTTAYTSEVYDMQDNLMPVDTLPGFIIRSRAQSTFVRG
jgi:uncharacterized phage protein gp47/JayE